MIDLVREPKDVYFGKTLRKSFARQEEVLEMYSESAKRHGMKVSPETIRQQMSLANLNTTFRYWHMYLHGSEEKRVRDIYEKMVDNYVIFVKSH